MRVKCPLGGKRNPGVRTSHSWDPCVRGLNHKMCYKCSGTFHFHQYSTLKSTKIIDKRKLKKKTTPHDTICTNVGSSLRSRMDIYVKCLPSVNNNQEVYISRQNSQTKDSHRMSNYISCLTTYPHPHPTLNTTKQITNEKIRIEQKTKTKKNPQIHVSVQLFRREWKKL
jgi:hypothetical protein